MAPPYAVLIWSDQHNIYCEFCNSPGAVISFPNSAIGLQKVLALFSTQREAAPQYIRPPILAKALKADGLDLTHVRAADATLKELGIIK